MSYKDVLRVFKLERDLTDNETALLNTLRSMSESEREMLAETVGPVKVATKSSKPATRRNIEHCGICDFTRRAAHHKEGHKDYHEFHSRTERPAKSARASSLASAIKGTSKSLDGGVSKMRCAVENCGAYADDLIHDPKGGYESYHPFFYDVPSAVGQSSTGESGVSSEVETASV